ncbi:histidine kinase, partial [bacterium]
GEEKRLQQAFLNILLNAEQAIKDNGRIVVSMDKRGEDYIIKITDNGKGISEKERERIFEPFFTTKPAGSGLGLSVVKSIVEEHGGKIDIASEPGSQTTVTIILPIQSNKAREPNDTKAQEQ